MGEHTITIIIRLAFALLAGGLIGVERAYNGRPAGLRTHSLVCVSSSLLMLFSVFQWKLLDGAPFETLRVDPTRMAQGIMTGIGFLGAGVIMKEKFSIRGLTTAASIWMTASVGVIIGMGFYLAAGISTFITLVVLSSFGWLERKLPSLKYARLKLRIKGKDVISKDEILKLIEKHEIKGFSPSYHFNNETDSFYYQFNIRASNQDNLYKLEESLRSIKNIEEFSVIPTGD